MDVVIVIAIVPSYTFPGPYTPLAVPPFTFMHLNRYTYTSWPFASYAGLCH